MKKVENRTVCDHGRVSAAQLTRQVDAERVREGCGGNHTDSAEASLQRQRAEMWLSE